MSEKYTIFASTLKGIADAVRVIAKTDAKIPVGELDNVLLGQSVSTLLPEATGEIYLIDKQTLVDIADAVRFRSNTSGKIPVLSLAARILELAQPTAKKLETPLIWLHTEGDSTGGGSTKATPAILGLAILGKTTLGVYDSLERLEAPTIQIIEVADGEEEPGEPIIIKLDEPIIWIDVVDDNEPEIPDEPVIVKLATPVIYINEVEDEPVLDKLATPTIYIEVENDLSISANFDFNTMFWDEVPGASSYNVSLYANDGTKVANTNVKETSINVFDTFVGFNCLVHGAYYTIALAAIASDGTTLCETNENWRHIEAPVCTVDDGDLCWNAVEGAVRYIWSFMATENGVDSTWSTLMLDSSYDRVGLAEGFNLNSYEPGSTLTTYIIATDGTYFSEPSNMIVYEMQEVPQLGTPPVITLDGAILTWNAVENADMYRIYCDDSAVAYAPATSFDLSTLSLQPGTHEIKIAAINKVDSSYGDFSNVVTYAHKVPLATPEISIETYVNVDTPVIAINDSIISWNAVDDATNYWILCDEISGGISIEGKALVGATQGETSFDVIDVLAGKPAGIYTFCVVALGESYETMSNFSNSVTYDYDGSVLPKVGKPKIYVSNYPLDRPEPFMFSTSKKLMWSSITGADTYYIYYQSNTGKSLIGSASTSNYDMSEWIAAQEPGTYEIFVRAYNSATNEYSEMSEPYTLTIE